MSGVEGVKVGGVGVGGVEMRGVWGVKVEGVMVRGAEVEGVEVEGVGSGDGAGWLGGLAGEGADGEEDGGLLAEVAGT